jgi:hypothetical protein
MLAAVKLKETACADAGMPHCPTMVIVRPDGVIAGGPY